MELAQVVARRRMVRAYTDRSVDPQVLDRILDTARRAPSAGFTQAQSFVVVTDPQEVLAIARIADEEAAVARGLRRWVSGAAVLIVPCVRPADYDERYAEADKAGSRPPAQWDVPWAWVDAGQALMLLLLAAVDEGLAAGLLDVDDHDGLRAVLGIPPEVAPLGVVTVGHPNPAEHAVGSAVRRPRRPLSEVVHHGRWRSS